MMIAEIQAIGGSGPTWETFFIVVYGIAGTLAAWLYKTKCAEFEELRKDYKVMDANFTKHLINYAETQATMSASVRAIEATAIRIEALVQNFGSEFAKKLAEKVDKEACQNHHGHQGQNHQGYGGGQ